MNLDKYRYVVTSTGNTTHIAQKNEVSLCNLYRVYDIMTRTPFYPICKECQRKLNKLEGVSND